MTCFGEFAERLNFWSEEFEEKLIELWKKHACLYYISTKAFSDRIKKAAALENISQEWINWWWWWWWWWWTSLVGISCINHTSQCSTGKLQKHDWPASRRLAVRSSTGSVTLPIVGDSWVASVRVSIATQLNSTRRRVELSCNKRALRLLLKPQKNRLKISRLKAITCKVWKYYNIFENIKISKISKISWYFWYFRYYLLGAWKGNSDNVEPSDSSGDVRLYSIDWQAHSRAPRPHPRTPESAIGQNELWLVNELLMLCWK